VRCRARRFARHLDVAVVVIEAHPTSEIVELSRDRKIDLLTGDATNDTTLDLCNLEHAAALVALTDSDTMNLEVGLGARARNAELPIVLRVGESAFAESVERHFGFSATYAAAGLAAPAFAGLARSVADRGRISIDHNRYRIVEFHASADRVLMPDDAFPLSTAGDLVLALVPER
jgi:voltage-gated potassium channel Kch